MCIPCFPYSDVDFEEEPRRSRRQSQAYQYVWNGQNWVLQPYTGRRRVSLQCLRVFFCPSPTILLRALALRPKLNPLHSAHVKLPIVGYCRIIAAQARTRALEWKVSGQARQYKTVLPTPRLSQPFTLLTLLPSPLQPHPSNLKTSTSCRQGAKFAALVQASSAVS